MREKNVEKLNLWASIRIEESLKPLHNAQTALELCNSVISLITKHIERNDKTKLDERFSSMIKINMYAHTY